MYKHTHTPKCDNRNINGIDEIYQRTVISRYIMLSSISDKQPNSLYLSLAHMDTYINEEERVVFGF